MTGLPYASLAVTFILYLPLGGVGVGLLEVAPVLAIVGGLLV